jgi:hypothetical protein
MWTGVEITKENLVIVSRDPGAVGCDRRGERTQKSCRQKDVFFHQLIYKNVDYVISLAVDVPNLHVSFF